MRGSVDLIMATCGAREAVERCITSLFDVAAGHPFTLTVFDNLASQEDGTRDWLRQAEAGHDNMRVILSRENMGHGHCLDYLVAHTVKPLIVTLDSDLVFTPAAAGWLAAMVDTHRGGAQMCGDAIPPVRGGGFRGVWLSRILPTIFGVRREFLRRWSLGFTPCRWRAVFEPCTRPLSWAPPDKHRWTWSDPPPGRPELWGDGPVEFRADVGWQFQFVLDLCGRDALAPLPSVVRDGVRHLHGQSRNFLLGRTQMRVITVYRRDGLPPVRGQVGSMAIFDRQSPCLRLAHASVAGEEEDRLVLIPYASIDRIVPGDVIATNTSPTECPQTGAPNYGEEVEAAEVPRG